MDREVTTEKKYKNKGTSQAHTSKPDVQTHVSADIA